MREDVANSGPQLIKLREVMALTSLSKATFYRLIARNSFPKQLHYSTRAMWVRDEVQEWIRARIAERDRAMAA
jgi:prophage regulatory protein